MRPQEEIEQLAKDSWEGCDGCDAHDEYFFIKGFSNGYRNGYRDNTDKKYTQEDIMKAIVFGYRQNSNNGYIDNEEERDFIQSLNKQD